MDQQFLGYLDQVDASTIEGWAVDPDGADDSAHVDVIVDGMFITCVKANGFREDLKQAGVRAGYARFTCQLPRRFADGVEHVLELRHAGTDLALGNTPAKFKFGQDAAARAAERRDWAMKRLVLHDATKSEGFAAAIGARRRVALVSTFYAGQTFMQYHQALFASLIDAGFVVVVVHAAADERMGARLAADPPVCGEAGRVAPEGFVPECFVIIKSNVGYDFGSWAVGMFALEGHFDQIDELLLLNDSIIEIKRGGIAEMIGAARAMGRDVVGVTDSYERRYHLQSYMLWFGTAACRSDALRMFMAGYSFSSNKETVIEEGELGLTGHLLSHGFSIGCLHPYERLVQRWIDGLDRLVAEIEGMPEIRVAAVDRCYKARLLDRISDIFTLLLNGTPVNPTHFFWDTLIEDGVRLIKRELLIRNPVNVPTLFRLGRVLPRDARIESDILDVRRRYGGELVPVLWQPSARAIVVDPPALSLAPKPAPASVRRRAMPPTESLLPGH